MMVCNNCGAKIEHGSTFCTECGAVMEKVQRPKTRKEAIKAGQLRNHGRPPIPPITLTGKLVSVFVELIILLFVILVMTTVVNDKFSAEKIAESYFVKMVNGDYKSAYKMLDLEEDEFVNRDNFITYAKQMNYSDIVDYAVDETGGVSSDSDSVSGTVNILYHMKDAEYEHHYTVDMYKDGDKKLLFFDNWKVSRDSVLAKNSIFAVANGAQLKIDGRVVDPAIYLIQDDYDAQYNDKYLIPQMFRGIHTVEIAMEGMESIRDNIMMDSSESAYEYTNMYCTEETAKEIQTLAVNNIYRIYDAAVKGKAFDEIAPLFAGSSDDIYYIAEDYNGLVMNLHESIQVNSISFSNIVSYGDTSSTRVEVYFDYVINGMTQDWWTENWEPETIQNDGSCYFEFVNENGEWKQTSLDFAYLY